MTPPLGPRGTTSACEVSCRFDLDQDIAPLAYLQGLCEDDAACTSAFFLDAGTGADSAAGFMRQLRAVLEPQDILELEANEFYAASVGDAVCAEAPQAIQDDEASMRYAVEQAWVSRITVAATTASLALCPVNSQFVFNPVTNEGVCRAIPGKDSSQVENTDVVLYVIVLILAGLVIFSSVLKVRSYEKVSRVFAKRLMAENAKMQRSEEEESRKLLMGEDDAYGVEDDGM